MTPIEQELSARLGARSRWWRAGMLTAPDRDGRAWRVVAKDAQRTTFTLVQEYGRKIRSPAPCIGGMAPDLTDPATLGCLLAMLREVHPHACSTPMWGMSGGPLGHVCGYRVSRDRGCAGWQADTEGEAIARALLAAWGPE